MQSVGGEGGAEARAGEARVAEWSLHRVDGGGADRLVDCHLEQCVLPRLSPKGEEALDPGLKEAPPCGRRGAGEEAWVWGGRGRRGVLMLRGAAGCGERERAYRGRGAGGEAWCGMAGSREASWRRGWGAQGWTQHTMTTPEKARESSRRLSSVGLLSTTSWQVASLPPKMPIAALHLVANGRSRRAVVYMFSKLTPRTRCSSRCAVSCAANTDISRSGGAGAVGGAGGAPRLVPERAAPRSVKMQWRTARPRSRRGCKNTAIL